MQHLVALFAAGLFVRSPLVQDEPVLKYRFGAGQALVYDVAESIQGESTVGAKTEKFDSETITAREWRVESVEGNGNARITLRILRVRVTATNPDGTKIQIDTEKD